MNYIRECNAFQEWIYRNAPSTGQIALWYALFHIWNKSGWKEWFNAPSITLELGAGLSRQSVINCRDYLVENGLIEVRIGGKNKAAEYKMIPFTSKNLGIQIDNELGNELDNEVVNELDNTKSTSENLGIQLAENLTILKQETETKKKNTRQNKVYDENSIPYRSANYLYTSILKYKPDLKKPNLQVWANDMKLLIENDGRNPMEVARVIDWVVKHHFWKTNCLSAFKLRKQWDQITAQMISEKERSRSPYERESQSSRLELVKVTDSEREEFEAMYERLSKQTH